MNITATEFGVVRLFAIEAAETIDHAKLAVALGIAGIDENCFFKSRNTGIVKNDLESILSRFQIGNLYILCW